VSRPDITVGEWESGTADFQDWGSLAAYLMRYAGDSGYIWRGQPDASWSLLSSLERAFRDGNIQPGRQPEIEQRALSHFRANAAAYLDWVPADNDVINWLVLMQHYGCPTRLLDWTESPFVASYFAYSTMPDKQDAPAALWSYDARITMNALQKRPDGNGLDFPKPRDSIIADETDRLPWPGELNGLVRAHIKSGSEIPLPVAPVRPDGRMIAQQTILTVDARLNGGIPHPLRTPEHLPLVLKIELPAAWRRDVLRNLDLMGITAASLFPGASGVAQDAGRIIRDDFRHVRSEVEGH
jgi:FRG domain